MLIVTMPKSPDRAVLTVTRTEGMWSVEHEGRHFGVSCDKEIAMAAANRQAREWQDSGRACRVRVAGEPGFWAER
jgi:hypothetical protein